MDEKLLHYIWQQKLFVGLPQQTTDGQPVEVINVGQYNTGSGPDFFNAKVKIGGMLMVGNVEIHVHTSDWFHHHHEHDEAYDNVILHVVQSVDGELPTTPSGRSMPTMVLAYPQPVQAQYERWLSSPWQIMCADRLAEVPSIFLTDWKTHLLAERLEQKRHDIEVLLQRYNGSWEEAFYVSLARNFGFHTNSQPFESLAASIPLNALGRHKDNLQQVEALLFGQAGFLETADDDYSRLLQREYTVLKAKFNLTPMRAFVWKTRMRPDNFPHVRIAQFAKLIHVSSHLFRQIQDTPRYEDIQKLFQVEATGYWDTHYRFSVEGGSRPKTLGKNSIDVLIINTVVPYLFVYAHEHGDVAMQDRALDLLQQIPAESNSQITTWRECGLTAETAFDTQALLQLRQHYCDERRCLQCRIALQILKHL